MGVMVVSSVTTYGQTRRPGDKYYNMNVLVSNARQLLVAYQKLRGRETRQTGRIECTFHCLTFIDLIPLVNRSVRTR